MIRKRVEDKEEREGRKKSDPMESKMEGRKEGLNYG